MIPRKRTRVVQVFTEPSLTKQAPAQETDINYIVNRYLKVGQMPMPESEPQFGYVPSIDLQEAFEMVMNAEQGFADLPAKVRAAYQNDPLMLLQAMEDPSQRETLEGLGVLKGREVIEPPAGSETVVEDQPDLPL